MSSAPGTPFSFPEQSGNLAYSVSFVPPTTNNIFFFSLGASGLDPSISDRTGMHFLGFTGQSGKLIDNDNNYVHSYVGGGAANIISGNVFSGYHNYFINGVPGNLNCCRRTGEIDSIFISGINSRFYNVAISKSQSTITATD